MKELKIIKTANNIQDICVAYGLCSILEFNEIEYVLKEKSNRYGIEIEELNTEELLYNPIDADAIWNINSNMNKGEINKNITKINQYIESNIDDVFKHFLGEEVKINKDKDSAISIGNNTFGLGLRGGSNPTRLKISTISKTLSMLGWIVACSYAKNKKTEVTMLMSPKNTNEIKKPYNFSYTDKETGEVKILSVLRGSSEVNIMANMYLETIIKYTLVNEEYSNVTFIQGMLAGNKPLPDKTISVKIHNVSIDYCRDILKKLNWSIYSEDVKDVTSKYVLNMDRYSYFAKLIKVYSRELKNKPLINIKFKEEILNMYSEIVRNIYNNEIVQKLGKGLNRLLYNKKGFEVQAKFYNVLNEKHLQHALKLLLDTYKREQRYNLLTNTELLEIINLIDNKDKARICSDAILAYSRVFIESNKDKEVDVEEEIENE